jgi:hypothetical protein
MNTMKSIACFVFVLICVCVQSGYAQLEKGNVMVGGSMRFSRSTTKNSSGTPTAIIKSFSISPDISYFLTDRFAAGLSFPYSFYRTTDKVGNFGSFSQTYSIGPKVRYYFPFGKWAIFPELNYGLGKQIQRYTTFGNAISKFQSVRAGAGIAYFMNSHVAVEGLLFYQFSRNNPGGSINEITGTSVYFNVGLQVYLNRSK